MIRRLALAIALAAALSGCAARAATIAQLKIDPSRFHDKTVRIEGVVTQASGEPRTTGAVYKIDDGSGEITVVSAHPVSLARGARVRVTGTLASVDGRNGRSGGLHVQEQSLDLLPSN